MDASHILYKFYLYLVVQLTNGTTLLRTRLSALKFTRKDSPVLVLDIVTIALLTVSVRSTTILDPVWNDGNDFCVDSFIMH